MHDRLTCLDRGRSGLLPPVLDAPGAYLSHLEQTTRPDEESSPISAARALFRLCRLRMDVAHSPNTATLRSI